MKKKIIYFSFIILLAVSSCKKGGTGGSTDVITIVTHHGKAIVHARVFVKYGSYNFAGTDTSSYDNVQFTGDDGYITFKGLKVGYYSFYAIGYDSTIKATVKGNAEIKVKRKDHNKECELGVPVTE